MSRKSRKSAPYSGVLTRPMVHEYTQAEFDRRWIALCRHYQLDPMSPTISDDLLDMLILDHVPGFSLMRAPGRPRGSNEKMAKIFDDLRRAQPSWSKTRALQFMASLRMFRHEGKSRRGQPMNAEAIRAMIKRGSEGKRIAKRSSS